MTREEAVEVYHGLINEKIKEAFEFFAPELAESEDERIRKWIIEKVQGYADSGIPCSDEIQMANKALAYLEKQKEQKPMNNPKWNELTWKDINELEEIINHVHYEFRNGISAEGFGKEVLEQFRNMKEDAEVDACEQKPSMIQWKGDNLKEVIDFTGKSPMFNKWFKSFEEYEEYVHSHGNIFKLFNEDGAHYEVPVGAWIVKTPDGCNMASKAVFRQKPAEWSEEDEENFKWFDKFFRAESVIAGGRDIPQDKYLWFKSLRPSWKPSEEQMNAIDYVLRYDKTGEFRDALKSLYDQLYNMYKIV